MSNPFQKEKTQGSYSKDGGYYLRATGEELKEHIEKQEARGWYFCLSRSRKTGNVSFEFRRASECVELPGHFTVRGIKVKGYKRSWK